MAETDDVIAAHRPAPNVLVHRPRALNVLQPACEAANNDGDWQRHGAWLARKENASWCHDEHCFPKGWASD